MTGRLITADVWDALSEAGRRSKKSAHVAVAYFGKGAAQLLHLAPGSRLVVDASETAVKSGQTHPADLEQMRQRKAIIYSYPSLHAKVFAFDKAIFIGSANASKHSATALQEAVFFTTDAPIARTARRFIKSLCLEQLGPEELKRLQKLYRPPRFAPGIRSKKGRLHKQSISALRVANIREVDVPERLGKAFAAGYKEAKAKRKHSKGYYVEEFYWPAPSTWRNGQLVMIVSKNAHGRAVSPPGHVIHLRSYRNGKERKTLVYVELPDRDWKPFSRLAKQTKKILKRGGPKNASLTKELLSLWRSA